MKSKDRLFVFTLGDILKAEMKYFYVLCPNWESVFSHDIKWHFLVKQIKIEPTKFNVSNSQNSKKMSFSNPSFSWWHYISPLQHRKLEKIYRWKICFKIHEVLHHLSNDSIKEKKNEKNKEKLKSDILSSEKKRSLFITVQKFLLKGVFLLLTF